MFHLVVLLFIVDLNVNVCIKPAEPNFGIVFKRVDLKKIIISLSKFYECN